MNPTRQLHEFGQSLWLDNINRTLSTTEPWCGTSPTARSRALTSNPARPAPRGRLVQAGVDQTDGSVSLEASPLLAADTASSIAAARQVHDQARRANLMKIPGPPQGVAASLLPTFGPRR